MSGGLRIQEKVREKLVEAKAVVAVVDQESIRNSSVMFELGMAMGWDKPVWIIMASHGPSSSIPLELRDWKYSTIDNIDTVCREISEISAPLNSTDRDILGHIYQQNNVGTDKLVTNPNLLADLSRKFNKRSSRKVSSSILLQELIRMRKSGKLPTLTQSKRSQRID